VVGLVLIHKIRILTYDVLTYTIINQIFSPHSLPTLLYHPLKADSTRTTRSLANELETSHSTVERHLHELGMQFHVDRWVYIGVPGTSASTSSATPYEPQPSTSNVNTPAPSTTSSSSSSWTQSPAAISTAHQQPQQSPFNW
jgi:hypothetical protein